MTNLAIIDGDDYDDFFIVCIYYFHIINLMDYKQTTTYDIKIYKTIVYGHDVNLTLICIKVKLLVWSFFINRVLYCCIS